MADLDTQWTASLTSIPPFPAGPSVGPVSRLCLIHPESFADPLGTIEFEKKKDSVSFKLMKTLCRRNVCECCVSRLCSWTYPLPWLLRRSIWVWTGDEAHQSSSCAALGLCCDFRVNPTGSWRSHRWGMQCRGKGTRSQFFLQASPSADCHVCSHHELGRVLPEHHSHLPGSVCAFPDVELAKLM